MGLREQREGGSVANQTKRQKQQQGSGPEARAATSERVGVRRTLSARNCERQTEPKPEPEPRSVTYLPRSVTEKTSRKPSPVLMYCSRMAPNSSCPAVSRTREQAHGRRQHKAQSTSDNRPVPEFLEYKINAARGA